MRSWLIRVDYRTVGLRLNRQQEGLVFDYYFLVFTLKVNDIMINLDQRLFALTPTFNCLLADTGIEFKLKSLYIVRPEKVGRFRDFIDHIFAVVQTV
jgi:hypothetical protein